MCRAFFEPRSAFGWQRILTLLWTYSAIGTGLFIGSGGGTSQSCTLYSPCWRKPRSLLCTNPSLTLPGANACSSQPRRPSRCLDRMEHHRCHAYQRHPSYWRTRYRLPGLWRCVRLLSPLAETKLYSRSITQHRILHPRLPLPGPEFRHGCVVRDRYFPCTHGADAFFHSQPSDGMCASFGFSSFPAPVTVLIHALYSTSCNGSSLCR